MRRISTLFIILFLLTSFVILKLKDTSEPSPYSFPEISTFPEMPRSKVNPVTVEGVELGRFLFYDSILSENYQISCASCHRQETAFADGGVRISRGVNGALTTRNTPSLANLAWYDAFFWDGRAESIEDQVFSPVRSHMEMNLNWSVATERVQASKFYRKKFLAAFGSKKIDSVLIAYAIAQFERTLLSADSKYDRALRKQDQLSSSEYRGFVLMNDQSMADCLHCHPTDASSVATTGGFSNNGLDWAAIPEDFRDLGRMLFTANPIDAGKFKIPTLRNIEVTAPYMHDGRFETLEEVLDFYSDGIKNNYAIDPKMTAAHRGGVRLSDQDKKDIIAFLKTLTDSTFLTNAQHSNPWRAAK
jgi:cytochrome c peroxidase